MVRKLDFCCSAPTFSLFFLTFGLTMVVGLEWNVLEIPGPLPKSGDQLLSHERSARELADLVLDKSQDVTAHAKIIHRDSLSSPFRRRNVTREELMRETLLRDQARVASIQKHVARMVNGAMTPAQDFKTTVFSGLIFGGADYFAMVGVGTPHRYMYLLLDTGSDMTWLQCAPCTNCYKQKSNALFYPSNSSTFKFLDCHADLCLKMNVMGCMSNKCLYQINYGDGSFSMGELATDNVAMDAATGLGQVVLTNIPVGCGHDNQGSFGGVAGMLGLGKGPLSFPSNINSSSSIQGSVFSYCLPDRNREDSNQRSTLIFGDAAIPDHAADSVMFTPQLQNHRVVTYYYVQMTGISVAGNLLTTIPGSAFLLDMNGNGGTIVDSGTTVSRLQTVAYTTLRDAFRENLHTTNLNLKSVGGFQILDTCYDFSGHSGPVSMPSVTLHFLGGVDMQLPASNYMIAVDDRSKFCFAFAAEAEGPSILGNIQQQNFQVIYDNARHRIGFYPSQCY